MKESEQLNIDTDKAINALLYETWVGRFIRMDGQLQSPDGSYYDWLYCLLLGLKPSPLGENFSFQQYYFKI